MKDRVKPLKSFTLQKSDKRNEERNSKFYPNPFYLSDSGGDVVLPPSAEASVEVSHESSSNPQDGEEI